MKRILPLALCLALAAPAAAQDSEPEVPGFPFLDLWADRTEEMMREFIEEFGPEMEAFMSEMIPRLQELGELVGGLRHYQLPEILPNGDIIIRRKPDAPPLPEDLLPPPEDPIDL